MREARCKGEDEKGLKFFPKRDNESSSVQEYEGVIKELCNKCPVQTECLVFALKRNEHYGVWGGLTTRERKLLRKRVKFHDPKAL
jgi:WhiB family transcriptional regulator, redox-sensing transcriptional regulator